MTEKRPRVEDLISAAAAGARRRGRADRSGRSARRAHEAARLAVASQADSGALFPVQRNGRICKKCGARNPASAKACATCGSVRLAPPWVLARREVTKLFEVQITSSSERFGPPVRRITLSKWWPGSAGRSPSFNIPTPTQWARVRDIVERDFGPRLGWQVPSTYSSLPNPPPTEAGLRDLARQHPARQAWGDPDRFVDAWSPEAVALVKRISRDQATLDRPFGDAYRALIERLPREGGAALVELQRLLESWSLHQVTQLTAELGRRLEAIDLFEQIVLDEKTYELKGERSIHRVLESAMWIVDDRYWLMSSNRTLRTLIGGKMRRARRGVAALRPDFACAQLATQGVIVELKRPAHRLTVQDLNQAERYLVLAERYARGITWTAILVGSAATEEARRTAKHRTAVTIQSFADLLADARQRYREYLKIARPGDARCEPDGEERVD